MYRRYYPKMDPIPSPPEIGHLPPEKTITSNSEIIVPEKMSQEQKVATEHNPTEDAVHHIVSGLGGLSGFGGLGGLPSFIESIFHNICIDDLIIIGVLLLFLREQIEDEFMMLILVALLIIGFDRS